MTPEELAAAHDAETLVRAAWIALGRPPCRVQSEHDDNETSELDWAIADAIDWQTGYMQDDEASDEQAAVWMLVGETREIVSPDEPPPESRYDRYVDGYRFVFAGQAAEKEG